MNGSSDLHKICQCGHKAIKHWFTYSTCMALIGEDIHKRPLWCECKKFHEEDTFTREVRLICASADTK